MLVLHKYSQALKSHLIRTVINFLAKQVFDDNWQIWLIWQSLIDKTGNSLKMLNVGGKN